MQSVPDQLPFLLIHHQREIALIQSKVPQLADYVEFSIGNGLAKLEIAFGTPRQMITCQIEPNSISIQNEEGKIATFNGDDMTMMRLILAALGPNFRTRSLILPDHIHSNPVLLLIEETNFYAFANLLSVSHDWTNFEYLCQQLNILSRIPKSLFITDLRCECSKQQRNFAICLQCFWEVLRVDQLLRRDGVILMARELSDKEIAKHSLRADDRMWPWANFVVHLVKFMARTRINPNELRPRIVGLRFRDYTPQFQKRLVLGFDAQQMLSKDGLEVYRWKKPFEFYYVVVKDLEYVAVIREFEMNMERIINDTLELFTCAEMVRLRD